MQKPYYLNINLFWDRQELQKIEKLTIASFAEHFSRVTIFTYDRTIFGRIAETFTNVDIMDANEIIPENEKFYYKGNGDCPVKSIVGFSDIFRYKLLYMVGGWYSDFDVTCLKSFRSIDTPSTIIRPHETFGAASNICKFKRGDSILLDLYETTLKEVNADNCKWTKPLDIFRYKITEYSYNQYIIDDILLGKDSMVTDIQPLLNNDFLNVDVTNRYAIHWCKSAIKSGNWCSSHYYNIDDPFPGTLLSYLYTKYSIS